MKSTPRGRGGSETGCRDGWVSRGQGESSRREESSTHRKVAVIPRVGVDLGLHAVREALAYGLADCSAWSESVMERRGRGVVPDERVLAKRGQHVDDLGTWRGISRTLAWMEEERVRRTDRDIQPMSSSQRAIAPSGC